MRRKKEEPIIYHAPLGITHLPPEYELRPYSIEPETIEVTSLGDSFRRYTKTNTSLTYTNSMWEDETICYPSDYTYTDSYKELMKKLKGEDTMVNIECDHTFEGEYRVICKDKDDLSLKNVLVTISAAKGRLMLETAPVHIASMECKITPTIRHNIITASKKLNMYGKDMPIIARFDDFGNRLPDTISINGANGVSLKIVDPKDYGNFYFELTAIAPSSFEFRPSYDDLPF